MVSSFQAVFAPDSELDSDQNFDCVKHSLFMTGSFNPLFGIVGLPKNEDAIFKVFSIPPLVSPCFPVPADVNESDSMMVSQMNTGNLA